MIRKIVLSVFLFLITASIVAQAPQKFTYQAVVRNSNNSLVVNMPVGVRITILQDGVSGYIVYAETHLTATNTNGLITIEIGSGSVLQGSFAAIDWSSDSYFLMVEIDPTGGSSYVITSVQQLLSVPYALYAENAGNGFSGDYNDLSNKPQIPTVPTNVSAFDNDAGYVTMDSLPGIPINVSAFSNDVGYLTSFTENQILSISNDTIFLTGGSFVKLPAGFDGDYNSLTNRPDLFSGNYNDLTNKPTIPIVPMNVSAFTNDAGYITMDSIPAIPTVPTNVSAFTNDAGYLTGYTETDPQFNAWNKNYDDLTNKPTIPTVPANVSAFTNDAGYITMDSIPAIPLVPTNVSAFMNDAGYLTGYTETDPQFNAWNKNYDDLTNKPTIPTVPANVSAFTNDAGYMVEETQALSDVTAIGNSAGNRQLKDVSDPTESYDAVNLRTLTIMMDSLRTVIQQMLQQQHDQMQQQIDSLKDIISSFHPDTGNFVCGTSTISDYDGNVYNTVQIGQQCWTRENLRATHYADGTAIPAGGSNTSYTDPYYYDYSSSGIALEQRGLLYNWPAAMHGASTSSANSSGVQGICPTGWHVPSDGEWTQLIQYVGSQSNYLCGNNSSYVTKALAFTSGWIASTSQCAVGNTSASNNATGFSAVPAGLYSVSSFFSLGRYALFWSSTEYNSSGAYYRGLYYDRAYMSSDWNGKDYGYSVRCLRDSAVTDEESLILPDTTSYPTSDSHVDAQPCPGNPTITDYDGNVYNTVQIGQQCWMKENLRTTHYADGTEIPLVNTTSNDIPYRHYPNNDPSNVLNYGYLYNWPALMHGASSSETNPSGVQGICPTGWHVPSDAEWTQLTNYVGSQNQYVCGGESAKIAQSLAASFGWSNYITDNCAVGSDLEANNLTGFSALPAGNYNGSFSGFSYNGYFWSSTNAHSRIISYYGASLNVNQMITDGYSVRCIRDICQNGLSAVVFEESFDSPIVQMTTTSNHDQTHGDWHKDNTLHVSGTSSFHTPVYSTSTNSSATTADIRLTDLTIPNINHIYLEFDQICKMNNLDNATIYYAVAYGYNSNGDLNWSTWNQLVFTSTSPFYFGSGTYQGGKFNANCYSNWVADNNNATPTNSWWHHECFDLSSFILQQGATHCKFQLRSNKISPSSSDTEVCAGWYIDNFKVTLSDCEMIQ